MPFKTAMIIASAALISFTPMVASAHDNGYSHSHQNNNKGDRQLVGGAIGAVLGGVIGSQVSGNGARTEGSVLGAVVGGLAGAAIAGNSNGNTRYTSHYNNGGYYSAPVHTYPAHPTYYRQSTTYYTPPVYQQPVYQQPVYQHSSHSHGYAQPYYGGSSYYGTSRPAINISLSSGGYGSSYGGYHSRRGGYGQYYSSYPRSSYRGYKRRHGHH